MSHFLIDARGLTSPEPLLRLEEQARHLAARDTVELLLDDPMAEAEISGWCAQHRHFLLESAGDEDNLRLLIELGD